METSVVQLSTKVLTPGLVVKMINQERFLSDCEGIIIVIDAKARPDLGSIAVFFDKEVPIHEFSPDFTIREWIDGVPTLENYIGCPRIDYFEAKDLEILPRFSPQVLANRIFKNRWHHSNSWSFPLIPGSHACQFKTCTRVGTDGLAREIALVNCWGSVFEVYACPQCYASWHGMCADFVQFKKPLPGGRSTH